jgi:hypothetical protein
MYQVGMSGGNSINYYVEIDVQCSNLVKIIPPLVLYTDPIEFAQDTGEYELEINPFTTDMNIVCPVESYQVLP